MTITEMITRLRRDLKDEVPTPQDAQTLDDCDTLWTGTTNVTVTLDQTDYQQGIGCMKAVFGAGFTLGLAAYHNIDAVDMRPAQQLRLWIKTSISVSAGVLQIVLDDTAGCGSPLKYLDIPACQANVWHHHTIDMGDTGSLSAVASLGLYAAVNPADNTVRVDHLTIYGSAYKWSDDEMERHIRRALKDLSYYIPQEYRAELATIAGSRDIDIATLTDRVRVFAVEYPEDQFPPAYQRFSLWQDTVTLLGDRVPDGSDCRVYYGKLHTIDMQSCTLPAHLEDLLSVGAQGYALQAYASFAVDRLNPDYRYAQEQASHDAGVLLDHFRRQCKRLGRQGKLRPTSLYVPQTAPVDNTTVIGP